MPGACSTQVDPSLVSCNNVSLLTISPRCTCGYWDGQDDDFLTAARNGDTKAVCNALAAGANLSATNTGPDGVGGMVSEERYDFPRFRHLLTALRRCFRCSQRFTGLRLLGVCPLCVC